MGSNMLTPDTTSALLRASQSDSGQASAKLKQALKGSDTQAVDAAAEDFEAVFLAEMLKPMFEGLEPDPVFGGGKGEEIFQSMMIQEYGKVLAQSGGVGIADRVKEELIKMQENAETLS